MVSSKFIDDVVDVDVDVDTDSISTKPYHTIPTNQFVHIHTYIHTYTHIIAQPILRSNSNIDGFVPNTIVAFIHTCIHPYMHVTQIRNRNSHFQAKKATFIIPSHRNRPISIPSFRRFESSNRILGVADFFPG